MIIFIIRESSSENFPRSSSEKLSAIKSAKTLTKTISKLNTQKNVYKFRIRPYAKVNGKTVYGSWSNIVSAG